MAKILNPFFRHPRNPWMRGLQRRTTATLTSEDIDLSSAKPLEDIPGFRSFPIIGTSWVFYPIIGKYAVEQSHIYDEDKYKLFGDISLDKFGPYNLVNIFNHKDVETLLRNESKYPSRGSLFSLNKYRELRKDWYQSKSVLLTNGHEWYDLRFKLQRHLMKPKTMDRFIDPITEVTRSLINRLVHMRDKNNEVADTMKELFKWSLESIAFVSLEKRLGCLDVDSPPDSLGHKMIEAAQTSFECMNKLEVFTGSSIMLWKYFPTPTWKKFVKAQDVFSEAAFNYVQEAVEDLKDRKLDVENFTLLQSMIASKDIKPEEAVTMVMDMLMAGIDTTSNTIGFLLYNLAKNPDKQEKLYQEIKQFLPTPDDKLTPEKLADMRYLKLCLKESIRVIPTVRGLGRQIDRDMILSGYRIPAGTLVLVILPTINKLEKYFENPDKFLPERWDDRDTKPSPFLYVPFGFGTRSCIGRRIAELEMWILIVEILRKFRLEYNHEEFKLLNRLVNIADRPLKFTFIDR